jgi:branched-chain amino acid transport system ATP-binding protein
MTNFQVSTVLSARGVHKSFGAVTAAEDINIDILAGQRVSLIGSNGAGKTTFVNMVTGYLKPDAGTIELNGKTIVGLGPRQISALGIARSFQIPQLALEMTALDNMLVAAACNDGPLSVWRPAHSPARIERAEALLEKFDLIAHINRRVAELPGGVRKLLDIAMALTGEPKLLLLDEPTSGVSVDEKFPMMDTISTALSSEVVTVLFVEHDMDIVTNYSDRVIAFYSGRVIADDKPDTVLDNDEVQLYVTGSAKQGHSTC